MRKRRRTAKIAFLDNINDVEENIFIPQFIQRNSINYYITDISEGLFEHSKIKSLNFAEEVRITSIPKETFAFSTIQQLHLPSGIEKLEEGWCHETPELIKITVSLKNKYFQNFNDQLVIGKQDGQLYFASRNIEEIIIPSEIKQINKYSFENCRKLKRIKFLQNSQLKRIEAKSFSKSSIEEIEIPSKFEEMEDNWCYLTSKLKKIKLSSKNQKFVSIGDKILICKSNNKNDDNYEDNYDTLCFVSRSIDKVIIPSTIQYFKMSSYSKLSEIKTINNHYYKISSIFDKLPTTYEKEINNIANSVIKNMYSKFVFKYCKLNDDDDDEFNNKNSLFNLFFYLVNFKFITFQIMKDINTCYKNDQDLSSKVNIIFCVENHIIICEQIKLSMLKELIIAIKKQDVSLIDVSNSNIFLNNGIDDVIEEIQSFCCNFHYIIKNNYFLNYTIKPIIGYLIRRFYYPSNYFIDNSFFFLDQTNYTKEQYVKNKINNFLINNIEDENIDEKSSELKNIMNEMKEQNDDFNKENSHREFKEAEFIKLRTIYTKDIALYYLVIHLETFYIYMMEKYNDEYIDSKTIKREIKIYENPHRCLTKIHGVLRKDTKIIGMIYEFMSNGSLDSYLKDKEFDNIYLFLTTNRIFNGINHLHKNELIHRDFKPGNVLVDHDGLPYISDFETIRSVNKSEGEFTCDIGSDSYSSPEQKRGENISYPTDIYSFGQIIKYLIEKKSIISNFQNLNDEIITINTKFFQNFFVRCVENDPKDRIKEEEIKDIMKNEMLSFQYFEEFLLNERNKINSSSIIEFIFENIINGISNDFIYFSHFQILNFQILCSIKINNSKSALLVNMGRFYENHKFNKPNYYKAKKYYELSSSLYNSDALNNLGNLYENGHGVKQDYLKAKEYYELSAELHNSNALKNLGDLYYYGRGIKQDYLQAKKYYELSSRLNNSDSLTNLGDIYYYGRGVKQNYLKAKEYYELSSKLNNSNALNKLGDLYYYGRGIEQDYLQAKRYYKLSSKLNNSDALNNLGLIYENGHGVEQDYLKAKKYYELSSKFNNSNALNNLGYLYYYGKGIKQDYLQAKKYFELSSKLNNSEAINYLGVLYFHGYGVKQDYLKAKEYFELSSKFNNSNALNNLGLHYFYGCGVKQDYLKAIKYYELSSELNNSEALNNLGILYYYGHGVKQDYLKAKKYFELSSELNNSNALNNLGLMYENGYGVDKDYLRAKKYYELSSELNNSNALNNLGDLYYYGKGVKQDYLQAKKYYEFSSKYNNPDSFINLGVLYYYGKGVERNYLKSKKYYEFSSLLNDSYAHFYLGNLHSSGEIYDINLTEAIKYYLKSIKIQRGIKEGYNSVKKVSYIKFETNNYRYISYNNLGLIYIIDYKNAEKAEEYLKESAFAEYPFGQNNFGLLNQFYLDKIDDAKYMYERSSKNNFSLADYNLGHIFEEENKIEKSIEFFIRASNHEKVPIDFRNTIYYDKRLEISKTFIICLTNLKLAKYFFEQNNYEESRKFFNKSIYRLKFYDKKSKYRFIFIFKANNENENKNESLNDIFSYLTKYILNFPHFNLINQPNLDLKEYEYLNIYEQKDENDIKKNTNENEKTTVNERTQNQNHKNEDINENEKINKEKNIVNKDKCHMPDDIMNIFNENEKNIENKYEKNHKMNDYIQFEDPNKLFEYVIKNSNNSKHDLKYLFIQEINRTIEIMNKILYTPPYSILFGRVSITKPKPKIQDKRKNIDHSFYEGFGI